MYYFNWEIVGVVISQIGLLCYIIYCVVNNLLIDKCIFVICKDYGVKILMVKGGDGVKVLMNVFKCGEFVVLMNDQKMNDGVEVFFFGYLFMMVLGFMWLVM